MGYILRETKVIQILFCHNRPDVVAASEIVVVSAVLNLNLNTEYQSSSKS